MLAGTYTAMRRQTQKTGVLVCYFSTFLAGERSKGVSEGSPASVYRTWMLDKQSIKLIVLEAGSLEWRKQVLGDDYQVLKLPCLLFCTF